MQTGFADIAALAGWPVDRCICGEGSLVPATIIGATNRALRLSEQTFYALARSEPRTHHPRKAASKVNSVVRSWSCVAVTDRGSFGL